MSSTNHRQFSRTGSHLLAEAGRWVVLIIAVLGAACAAPSSTASIASFFENISRQGYPLSFENLFPKVQGRNYAIPTINNIVAKFDMSSLDADSIALFMTNTEQRKDVRRQIGTWEKNNITLLNTLESISLDINYYTPSNPELTTRMSVQDKKKYMFIIRSLTSALQVAHTAKIVGKTLRYIRILMNLSAISLHSSSNSIDFLFSQYVLGALHFSAKKIKRIPTLSENDKKEFATLLDKIGNSRQHYLRSINGDIINTYNAFHGRDEFWGMGVANSDASQRNTLANELHRIAAFQFKLLQRLATPKPLTPHEVRTHEQMYASLVSQLSPATQGLLPKPRFDVVFAIQRDLQELKTIVWSW